MYVLWNLKLLLFITKPEKLFYYVSVEPKNFEVNEETEVMAEIEQKKIKLLNIKVKTTKLLILTEVVNNSTCR